MISEPYNALLHKISLEGLFECNISSSVLTEFDILDVPIYSNTTETMWAFLLFIRDLAATLHLFSTLSRHSVELEKSVETEDIIDRLYNLNLCWFTLSLRYSSYNH